MVVHAMPAAERDAFGQHGKFPLSYFPLTRIASATTIVTLRAVLAADKRYEGQTT
jgi:hypothetical protein